MRAITFHSINPANEAIKIQALDGPGPGGASHRYSLSFDPQHPSNAAELAYKAYGDSTGGKNFRGDPMPAWDALPASIQQAWCEATCAVLNKAATCPELAFQNGPVKEAVQVHNDQNEDCALNDPETHANPATRGLPCSCPKQAIGINGITHEALIAVLIDRISGFQRGQYANDFNALALAHLGGALDALNDRTRERMARNVEGTHQK